jgi:hypothetical protein
MPEDWTVPVEMAKARSVDNPHTIRVTNRALTGEIYILINCNDFS